MLLHHHTIRGVTDHQRTPSTHTHTHTLYHPPLLPSILTPPPPSPLLPCPAPPPGCVDAAEVLSALLAAGLPATQSDATRMIQMLDTDGDNEVTYDEFCRLLVMLPAAHVREGGGVLPICCRLHMCVWGGGCCPCCRLHMYVRGGVLLPMLPDVHVREKSCCSCCLLCVCVPVCACVVVAMRLPVCLCTLAGERFSSVWPALAGRAGRGGGGRGVERPTCSVMACPTPQAGQKP